MKGIRILLIALAGTAFMASMAFANPATLPKHPGYPAAATKSPVDGTRTANDPGQGHANAVESASASANTASLNSTSSANNARMTPSKAAGQLPSVEGPLNKVKINPAGATSTVIN